ncbi:hypothetical protein BKA70DRAFT_1323670 [Coprinopsis sp. MPI-PUGE-AT-0042]|nr:hypothetical protein BKA70DRAFT_1323670 [Coprinopsis sp. MPI-PUGE-AT-0042]
MVTLKLVITGVFLARCVLPPVVGQQFIATIEELNIWFGKTDAHISYIDIRLVYCTTVMGKRCGGECFTYQGPRDRCIEMCHESDCTDCNLYTSCGKRLRHGFCATPSTNSISLLPHDMVSPTPAPPPHSAGIPQLTPSSITSTDNNINPASKFPVGAIVGVVMGISAMILAAFLVYRWIDKYRKGADRFVARIDSDIPTVAHPLPGIPMSATEPRALPATWNRPPEKLPEFGYQLSLSHRYSIDDVFTPSDASISNLQHHRAPPSPDTLLQDKMERTLSWLQRK